jgi:hypothetical protein
MDPVLYYEACQLIMEPVLHYAACQFIMEPVFLLWSSLYFPAAVLRLLP